MKTTLQKMMKRMLALGFGLAAFTGAAQAPCSLNMMIDVTNPAGGVVSDTVSISTQAGWSSYVFVNYGDGTNPVFYNTTSTPAYMAGYHQYSANGIYVVTTSMYSYDPADSSINCTTNVYDTVVIGGLPCSVDVGNILANPNGMMGYIFSTTVNSPNSPMIYWWISDSLGNTIYTQTGGLTVNYNFAQNGSYQVTCAAYAYDSASMTSCADTSYTWVSYGGGPSGGGGCNLHVGLNIYPNSGQAISIQGTATAAYQYSYIMVDGNVFYNTSNANYVLPAAGSYDVCFYAQDTTSATYCWDSVCVLYNTNGPAMQCAASFYLFQDSLNPTVWYGINNSVGSPYMTYAWDFGDGTTSTQAYPTHTYATPGNYIICLTAADTLNNCTSTYCDSSAAFRFSTNSLMGSLAIMAPTGIKTIAQTVSGLKAFPNPMTDLSTVAFSSTKATAGRVEVVGMLGNTVLSQEVSIAKGANEIRLNTATLTNGVYFIKIVSGTEVLSTVKAVK